MSGAGGVSAAGLSADFAALFGYAPLGCFRAPGRVNLIGEHTDYNNGFVLPIAIDRAVHVAIGRRGPAGGSEAVSSSATAATGTAAQPQQDSSIRIVSNHRDENGRRLEGQFTAEELVPGRMQGWLSHAAGVVFEIARTTGTNVSGIDLFIDSTVPVGAGLSSSHALEVAVLIALDEVFELGLGEKEKALLTQRAENDFVGAPTGIVDQAASIMSHAGHALFLDCQDLSHSQIPFDLTAHGLRLMVIDTRVSHSHSESGYGDRRRSCEAAAHALGVTSLRESIPTDNQALLTPEQLKRVRHVITENARVHATVAALEAGDLDGIGELLLASHESLAHDYEVSCPELDLAVATAMDAGALGARMTGGGFGGSAIAMVAEDRIDIVSAAVTRAFAAAGHREPHIFIVTAAAGAGRYED
ncbi:MULTISPECIES: galactokinase [unclassified Brevibacterium]|uniref:galactokinase n=1 Tax=unclassified Brevibacterium TaxID=2614124 RepID=UPI001E3D93DC|nr:MULTISPECIES: galactokinase [unclassified Brevibacterium]MCD1285863.1 galactokinase [Brevibacterium sp. CCUG 69071]MDK8434924.1 galactokinase [Brevibacterium sp. H-BE7]